MAARKPEQTYSPRRARETYLGAFSLSEIYRLIERGDLRAVKRGRKWIIFESSISEFIENLKRAEQHDRTQRGLESTSFGPRSLRGTRFSRQGPAAIKRSS